MPLIMWQLTDIERVSEDEAVFVLSRPIGDEHERYDSSTGSSC